MRDASCGPATFAQDRRDVAPSIEAPQPDLAAGDQTEQEDQRRVLGRQAALSLHPAPELLRMRPFVFPPKPRHDRHEGQKSPAAAPSYGLDLQR